MSCQCRNPRVAFGRKYANIYDPRLFSRGRAMLVAIGGHMGLSIPKPFYADLYGAGQRQVEDLKSHNMQQTDPACHVAAGGIHTTRIL